MNYPKFEEHESSKDLNLDKNNSNLPLTEKKEKRERNSGKI